MPEKSMIKWNISGKNASDDLQGNHQGRLKT